MSDFTDNYRKAQKESAEKASRLEKANDAWNTAINGYVDAYMKKNPDADKSKVYGDVERFVRQAADSENKFQGDDYDEAEYKLYGVDTLQALGNEDYGNREREKLSFKDWIQKYGSDEDKKGYDDVSYYIRNMADDDLRRLGVDDDRLNTVRDYYGKMDGTASLAQSGYDQWSNANNLGDYIMGGLKVMTGGSGTNLQSVWNAPRVVSLANGEANEIAEAEKKYKEYSNDFDNGYNSSDYFSDDLFDAIDNQDDYFAAIKANKSSSSTDGDKKTEGGASDTASASTTAAKTKNPEDTVTFSLTANDPYYNGFGQKIVDLGLATDHGLWGEDGDVAYYTKQLADQGALETNGNLKTGIDITLTRRGAEMAEPETTTSDSEAEKSPWASVNDGVRNDMPSSNYKPESNKKDGNTSSTYEGTANTKPVTEGDKVSPSDSSYEGTANTRPVTEGNNNTSSDSSYEGTANTQPVTEDNKENISSEDNDSKEDSKEQSADDKIASEYSTDKLSVKRESDNYLFTVTAPGAYWSDIYQALVAMGYDLSNQEESAKIAAYLMKETSGLSNIQQDVDEFGVPELYLPKGYTILINPKKIINGK